MGAGERRSARRWQEATVAAGKVTRWLAFRYLYAQAHNRHRPQKCQEGTKAMAFAVAESLVAGMGGDIRGLPPAGLDKDAHWTAFIRAAGYIDAEQEVALMSWLVGQEWGYDYQGGQYDSGRADEMSRLSLLLTTMAVQQRANDAGWIAGKGFQPRGRGRRPRRR